MERNRSDTVDEVAAVFAAYEAALVVNDVDRILDFFTDDAVRFGIADHQEGRKEQEIWRRAQDPLPPGRRLSGTRIHTYGTDLAVVTTFFDYPDSAVTGRQSQTWVRLPEGWRITTAHVSHPAG